MKTHTDSGKRVASGSLAAALFCTGGGIVPLAIYWLTCHRTITWWDSAQYSLAADTLGVAGPPGSLLLTLFGWLVAHLPLGISSALALNLFAGFLAACTVALTACVAGDLYGWRGPDDAPAARWMASAGIMLGALPLAFGPTLWTYAVKFTPYVLTAAFTALILSALVRWWRLAAEGSALKWVFVIALLVGVDFSVHRTNAMMAPGIALWVLLRRARTVASLRAWGVATGGLVSGLSLQLLLIPMAGRTPALNIGIPSNLSRLWEYISLQQSGGGFLLNILPRRAAFFGHQLRDVMEAVTASFAATHGALSFLGVVPLALAVYGLVTLWRKDARLSLAFTGLFVITVLTTVAYFNIPQHYFRPLHRHYLPCLVILGTISAYGAGAATARLSRLRDRRGATLSGAVLVLLAAVGINGVVDNYYTHDHSRDTFAYDYAGNLLRHLPPDSILLVGGDNDTFPLWYLQAVEGVRNDVTVVNISLTNAGWYIEHELGRAGGVAFSRLAVEMAALSPIAWEARDIALPAPAAAEYPDSVRIPVAPTAGNYLLVQDQVLMDVIRTNRWKRPVLIATTVSPSTVPWLRSHLRLEGLAFQFVAEESPAPELEVLRTNLLERYRYRGYADPSVYIDDTSAGMAQNLVSAFVSLAGAVNEAEGQQSCAEIVETMKRALPFDRLPLSQRLVGAVAAVCEPQ